MIGHPRHRPYDAAGRLVVRDRRLRDLIRLEIALRRIDPPAIRTWP